MLLLLLVLLAALLVVPSARSPCTKSAARRTSRCGEPACPSTVSWWPAPSRSRWTERAGRRGALPARLGRGRTGPAPCANSPGCAGATDRGCGQRAQGAARCHQGGAERRLGRHAGTPRPRSRSAHLKSSLADGEARHWSQVATDIAAAELERERHRADAQASSDAAIYSVLRRIKGPQHATQDRRGPRSRIPSRSGRAQGRQQALLANVAELEQIIARAP